jgi:hypothetical protein
MDRWDRERILASPLIVVSVTAVLLGELKESTTTLRNLLQFRKWRVKSDWGITYLIERCFEIKVIKMALDRIAIWHPLPIVWSHVWAWPP